MERSIAVDESPAVRSYDTCRAVGSPESGGSQTSKRHSFLLAVSFDRNNWRLSCDKFIEALGCGVSARNKCFWR
jgi:hypothetical protein